MQGLGRRMTHRKTGPLEQPWGLVGYSVDKQDSVGPVVARDANNTVAFSEHTMAQGVEKKQNH